ncbi:beta-glucosidase family protein [Novosphingobium endophyticum]|nr:glycoside hydrolase family 3 N-terminal domain-containing protein [Novosphingobium endophyticum]
MTKADRPARIRIVLAAGALALSPGLASSSYAEDAGSPKHTLSWMSARIVAEQAAAVDDAAKEAVANRRAKQLIAAMTLPQKMQQLTGSKAEILPELPQCYGARHVSGIASLAIPTFRITNGPVGVGQNDCVARSVYEAVKDNPNPYASYVAYTHPTSAKATALPSAMAVAASFDPAVATTFGEVIATEMNNLALHVFEAPGVNLARLPILGRNFEYFGEDPYLTGTMAVAETKVVQDHGIIAMVKHYVANEQETNRQTIQESVDQQTLRELYLLPFEMALKDGKAGAVMCAYNYVNGASSCESEHLLTDVLREDWGFTGYVQSDFFAMKSTASTLTTGMDHEMPTPLHWAPDKLQPALDKGEITVGDIDTALERRFTQMFKAGVFDRPLVQTPIDFAAGGRKAREVGTEGAVLLQNNGVLPFSPDVRSVVLIGKATQVYAQQAVAGGSMTGKPMGAGGGSSDVVPEYTVTPIQGLRQTLRERGNGQASVKLVLVDDTNTSATVDGTQTTFAAALDEAAGADAVVVMAGTVSEEGADRATFDGLGGQKLAASAAAGTSLDWYAEKPNIMATNRPNDNPAMDSRTVAMIEAVMATTSKTGMAMARKTALVLKDNAGVAMTPSLVGTDGPAILEVWFPGQEDGNIVADVVFGRTNPSGKLPVTFPYAGKGFLDHITPEQFPGVAATGSGDQTVEYSEKLNIGYRWYDANVSGECAPVKGVNPCVAFPFGHGLSYTTFKLGKARLSFDKASKTYSASVKVTNTGKRPGAEVIQVYISLPESASEVGARQPPKRLVGFDKVRLESGRSATVEISIDPAASNHPFSVWSETAQNWITPAGSHTIWVGRSSSPRDLAKAGSVSF